MDFFFDAITGARLTSLVYPQFASDTPSAKLAGMDSNGNAVPIPLRIQYGVQGASGTAYVPCAAPGGLPIKFALKPQGHYDDTVFDVFTDTFTAPTDPTQPTAFYTGSILIDGVALRALFPVAADGTSPDSVTLIAEVSSDGIPTRTFFFAVLNNIIKGTESPAISTPGQTYPQPQIINALIAGLTPTPLATNATKLSQVGITPGFLAVITGEGERIEQYLGPVSGAAGAGMIVAGAGEEDVNGAYTPTGTNAGKPFYNLAGSGATDPNIQAIYWDGSHWGIYTADSDIAYISAQNVATPDLVTAWSPGTGSGPAPTITRSDAANDANWLVLRNTVNLTVTTDTGATFNGVSVGDGSVTNVGWVDPAAISYPGDDSLFVVSVLVTETGQPLFFAGTAAPNNPIFPRSFALPCPCPPRASITVTLQGY